MVVVQYRRKRPDSSVRAPGGGISVRSSPDAFGAAEARVDAQAASRGMAIASRSKADGAFRISSLLGGIFKAEQAQTDSIELQEALHGALETSQSFYKPDGLMRRELGAARGMTGEVESIYDGMLKSASRLNPRVQQQYIDEVMKLRRSDSMTAADREHSETKKHRADMRAARRKAALDRAAQTPLASLLERDGFADFETETMDSHLGDGEDMFSDPDISVRASMMQDAESASSAKPSAPRKGGFASVEQGKEYLARVSRKFFESEDPAQLLQDLEMIEPVVPRELQGKFNEYREAGYKALAAHLISGGRLVIQNGGSLADVRAWFDEQGDGLPAEVRQFVDDSVSKVLEASNDVLSMKIDDSIADGDIDGAELLVSTRKESGLLSGTALQSQIAKIELARHGEMLDREADDILAISADPIVQASELARRNAAGRYASQADMDAIQSRVNASNAGSRAAHMAGLETSAVGGLHAALRGERPNGEQLVDMGPLAPAVNQIPVLADLDSMPDASNRDAVKALDAMTPDALADMGLHRYASEYGNGLLNAKDFGVHAERVFNAAYGRHVREVGRLPDGAIPDEWQSKVIGANRTAWDLRNSGPLPEGRQQALRSQLNAQWDDARINETLSGIDPHLMRARMEQAGFESSQIEARVKAVIDAHNSAGVVERAKVPNAWESALKQAVADKLGEKEFEDGKELHMKLLEQAVSISESMIDANDGNDGINVRLDAVAEFMARDHSVQTIDPAGRMNEKPMTMDMLDDDYSSQLTPSETAPNSYVASLQQGRMNNNLPALSSEDADRAYGYQMMLEDTDPTYANKGKRHIAEARLIALMGYSGIEFRVMRRDQPEVADLLAGWGYPGLDPESRLGDALRATSIDLPAAQAYGRADAAAIVAHGDVSRRPDLDAFRRGGGIPDSQTADPAAFNPGLSALQAQEMRRIQDLQSILDANPRIRDMMKDGVFESDGTPEAETFIRISQELQDLRKRIILSGGG